MNEGIKENSKYVPVRISPEVNEQLTKLAAAQKKSKSFLIRKYIDKGMSIDGYKQDEEELQAMITKAVENVINPATNRLASLSAKSGWLTAAAYFLLIYTLRVCVPENERPDMDKLVEKSRKLGITYLKTKDETVDEFIQKALTQLYGM